MPDATGFGTGAASAMKPSQAAGGPRRQEQVMAKGQKKSNKEARKPKAEKKKTIAANPSTKGHGGLGS
jgi:hypothetical protein